MEAAGEGAPVGDEFNDEPCDDDCYQKPDDLFPVFPDEGFGFFHYFHNFFLFSLLWVQYSFRGIWADAKR